MKVVTINLFSNPNPNPFKMDFVGFYKVDFNIFK